MNLIDTALAIALRAHTGIVDKAGQPYILHPIRIMLKMHSDEEKATALLHDVIEDSNITADDLRAEGIPETVIRAVLALTKQDNETYTAFVLRAKQHPIARKVKIADIEDNLNVLRIKQLTEKDLSRIAKYHAAWQVLQD